MAAVEAILVAEDDGSIRELLQYLLRKMTSCEVLTFPDGQALLGAISAVRPLLVLLDALMPGLSGIEVYRRLRADAATRTVPILFVTATPALVREAGLVDRVAVLDKPFTRQDLEGHIAALLADEV